MPWTPPATTDNALCGTASVTSSAAAIGASTATIESVLLQADPANTQNVKIGNAGAQTIVLAPGDVIALPASRIAHVYAKSASGTQAINYLGS